MGGICPTLSPSPGPRFTLVRPASSPGSLIAHVCTEDRPQEASAEGRRFAGAGRSDRRTQGFRHLR